MARTLIIAALTLVSVGMISAQDMSWRKHRKLGDDLAAEGQYYEAAENYRMAWEAKQSKTELIYMAGENYARIRDYRKAAEAYQHVQDKTSEYPLVGMKYARSLKQDGQYEKARAAFQRVQETYAGQDKAILQEIITAEIQGIDLATQLPSRADRRLEMTFPGGGINTEFDEFGGTPMDVDLLYYTSTMGGQARMYESRRSGRTWTKGATPSNFPVVQGGQYGNSALSPDGQRLYLTICNGDGGWQELNTRCEIYVIKRNGSGWSQPERLPDFINAKGVNTTHPAVAHFAGLEYVFFSSNRQGGRGGMDLWYVTRDMGRDNNDFTFPVNLGATINTLGDEVTPFYNPDEDMLYFASNGHPGLGGSDIFKSKGEEVNWTTPQNVGIPLNSSADDYGYVAAPGGFSGFVVSNRVFGGEKTNTRHFDLFEFSVGGRQMTLKANVYDKASGSLLTDVKVALYQVFEDGVENPLITKDFPNGSYLFELLPNRRFRVEVTRSGYMTGGYVFSTNDPSTTTYGQPLFLDADKAQTPGGVTGTPGGSPIMTEVPNGPPTFSSPGSSPSFPSSNPTNPGGSKPTTTPPASNNPPVTPSSPSNALPDAGGEYTARGITPPDDLEYMSSATRYQGTYFKLQLAAVRTYNPDHADFQKVATLGSLQTEKIPSRNLTRVLLADFFSEGEARTALSQVKRFFPNAYVVRYDNGVRFGKVNL